jgi:hypothetical protein
MRLGRNAVRPADIGVHPIDFRLRRGRADKRGVE